MRVVGTEAPAFMDAPGAAICGADWGGMRCVRIALGPGTDLGPVLKGLPDDRCPALHWGYVLEGLITVGYTDEREEILRAGDLFYLPPGHSPRTDEGVTLVEFSPEREVQAVFDHISRQMQG